MMQTQDTVLPCWPSANLLKQNTHYVRLLGINSTKKRGIPYWNNGYFFYMCPTPWEARSEDNHDKIVGRYRSCICWHDRLYKPKRYSNDAFIYDRVGQEGDDLAEYPAHIDKTFKNIIQTTEKLAQVTDSTYLNGLMPKSIKEQRAGGVRIIDDDILRLRSCKRRNGIPAEILAQAVKLFEPNKKAEETIIKVSCWEKKAIHMCTPDMLEIWFWKIGENNDHDKKTTKEKEESS